MRQTVNLDDGGSSPSEDAFIKEYKETSSLVKVGKLNAVTDNAIRKWLKRHNINPDKKSLQELIK